MEKKNFIENLLEWIKEVWKNKLKKGIFIVFKKKW